MLKIASINKDSLNSEEFNKLYRIIIEAYAHTEKEVWGDDYVRISKENYLTYIEQGEILIALLDGEIVGGIRFFLIEKNVWTFGLLGGDFNHTGKGIGRALISEVENRVKQKKGDHIKIEILRAEKIDVNSKVILSNWYQRMGYELISTVDVFTVYNDPDKWSKLVNPSVFDSYLKTF